MERSVARLARKHPSSRMISVFSALGLALVLMVEGGCSAIEATRHSPGSIKDGSFSPGRPPSAQYGSDPAQACPSGGAMAFLPLDLEDAAKKTGTPPVKADGRLCSAAEALLGWEKDLPDESVVRFVSWYFGLPAPIPRVTITPVPTEDGKAMAGMLLDAVSAFAKTAVQPRFGLATQRLHKDSSKVVLLMQDLVVDLDPVPKRLALNSQAPLSGRLVGDYANPKIVISNVMGQLETPSVPPGKAFQAELRCGDRPGRIQVEIRAEEKGAESIVATFPVTCGIDQPTSVTVAPPEQAPADAAREEKKVLELLNAERTSVGLAQLSWDDAVAGVARAISQSARDASRSGGSPSQIDVVERLKQADISSPLVLQNPGRARSAGEAHARFSTSPSHRANYTNPSITHAGIGVAAGTDANGRPSVFVTELFVKELPPVDTQAVREKLRAAIARRRSDARAPPLASDATLEEVAQRYAKALADAKGDLPKARADEILMPLHKLFRTVNVISGAKADPLEFAEEPGVVATAKLVGIGVAQGAHPVLGKNATYVVVLTGTRR
jgi:uncharacterized protein YkwD